MAANRTETTKIIEISRVAKEEEMEQEGVSKGAEVTITKAEEATEVMAAVETSNSRTTRDMMKRRPPASPNLPVDSLRQSMPWR